MQQSQLFMILFIIVIISIFFFIYYKTKETSSDFIKSSIYFGRTYRNETELSFENWNSYVDEVVTIFFPYGLTTTQSDGQMFDGTKIIKNKNFELLIVHKNDAKSKENIEKIIEIFRKKHNNELQVMKIQENISVDFYNRK